MHLPNSILIRIEPIVNKDLERAMNTAYAYFCCNPLPRHTVQVVELKIKHCVVVIRDVAQTVFSIKAQRDDAMENQDPFPIMDKARLEQNRVQKNRCWVSKRVDP